MADAVGFAASLATLVQVTHYVLTILKDIKRGGEDRKRLINEISNLHSILSNLEHHAPRKDREEEVWDDCIGGLKAKGGIFDQIEEVMSEIRVKLDPRKGWKGIVLSLTWPFVKEDVDRNVRQLERLSHNVSLSLQSFSFKALLCLSEGLDNLRANKDKEELRAILEWLSPLNFWGQQDIEQKKHVPGTCDWFLNSKDFMAWKSRKKPVFYCSAIAGAGKTVLASVAIDDLRVALLGQDAGIFMIYCKHDKPDSYDVEKLAMALLKQLVQVRSGNIPLDLEKLLDEHYRTQDTRPNLEEVLKVLNTHLPTFSQTFIVVDGLDEIENTEICQKVTIFLLQLSSSPSIMFTSRPIEAIKEMFITAIFLSGEPYSSSGATESSLKHTGVSKGFNCTDCGSEVSTIQYHCNHCRSPFYILCMECFGKEIRCPTTDHDMVIRISCVTMDVSPRPRAIRAYVRRRITQSPELNRWVKRQRGFAAEVEDEVTYSAQRMFLLAQLHMDAISDPNLLKFSDVRKALASLPQELNHSYDKAKDRVQGYGRSLLKLVSFAERPLRTREIEHALGVTLGSRELPEEDIIPITTLVSRCAGLVAINEDGALSFAHYTIVRYFRDSREKWFGNGHMDLAQICLTYLDLKAFDDGMATGEDEAIAFEARLTKYPFLGYASLFWARHTKESKSETVDRSAYHFLSNETHRNACVQALWFSSDVASAHWRLRSGASAIHLAIFFGLRTFVLRLLDEGAEAVTSDSLGSTPLMWAAETGDVEIVKHILNTEAPLNACNQDGATALHLAVSNKHEEVCRLLVNQPDLDINILHKRKGQSALIRAICADQPDTVRLLTSQGDVQINAQDYEGNTALHYAVTRGRTVVEILLEHPLIEVDKLTLTGHTPLESAIYNGDLEIVKCLLDAKANIEIGASVLGTVLNRAIDYDEEDIVRELIARKADWNVKDRMNRGILHSGAINGSLRSLRFLFEALPGVDINAQDINGNAPIHDAAACASPSVVELFLRYNAKIDIRNNRGLTPIDKARMENQKSNLEVLKKHYPNSFEMPDRSLSSSLAEDVSLLEAVKNNEIEMIDSIIMKAEQDKSIDLDERDEWLERTAMQHAADLGDLCIVEKLIAAGANINTPDKYGRTALHITVLRNHPSITRYLIQEKAEINTKDMWGATPLEEAYYCSRTNIAIHLIQYGAALGGLRDPTPLLFFAAEEGNTEACKRLVEASAKVQVKDEWGRSPYEIAKRAGHHETAEYLDRLGRSTSQPSLDLVTPSESASSSSPAKTPDLTPDSSRVTTANKSVGESSGTGVEISPNANNPKSLRPIDLYRLIALAVIGITFWAFIMIYGMF